MPFWRVDQMVKGFSRQGLTEEEQRRQVDAAKAKYVGGRGKLDRAAFVDKIAWDYVVLQTASRDRMDPVYAKTDEAIIELCRRFREAKANCRIVLYETWSAQDKPGDQAQATKCFKAMAKAHDMLHAPVGPAMHEAHARHPGLKIFRTEKDSHPGHHGGYLVACVLYATITGQTPLGLPHKLNLPGSYDFPLPSSERLKLEPAKRPSPNQL